MIIKQGINGCFAVMITIASNDPVNNFDDPLKTDDDPHLKHVYSYRDLTELEEREKKNFQRMHLEKEKEKEKKSLLDIRISPQTYH